MGDPDHRATALWKETLHPRDDDEHALDRDRLRVAYESMRARAHVLANQIRVDLPDFTLHDGTHLDRLWELVDEVRGDLALNPAEAFVLGGAILLHDLGMAVAAYPGGVREVRRGPDYEDALMQSLRSHLGRAPTSDELAAPDPAVVAAATGRVLRGRHARHAAELGEVHWGSADDRHYFLEDTELRRTYGAVVGKVASSHGVPAGQLPERVGPQLGPGARFPKEWTVEPIKLACLLRIADACHIDASRTPTFLATVQQPQGESRDHWAFQGRLNKVDRRGDRLRFTSREAFPQKDADAWWMAFDWLGVIDIELRDVDSLLADLGMDRLGVVAVAGATDPLRLAEFIETRGWRPVDARLHVSDVPALVSALGGEDLYGPGQKIPLRELLQNASDAVRARRKLENRDRAWGTVTVELSAAEDGMWVSVVDTGVGMAEHILAGSLLDFGASFWADEAAQEFPGLLGSGFESVGRYGIGFYSIFMWGGRIRVVSRRYDAAQEDTYVLEFSDGPSNRPTVRQAEHHERLADGGTRVEALLENPVDGEGGLLHREGEAPVEPLTLAELCGYLAPGYPVDLFVRDRESDRSRAIAAHDWSAIDGPTLVKRVRGGEALDWSVADDDDEMPDWIKDDDYYLTQEATRVALVAIENNLRPLVDDSGNLRGRACIIPNSLILGDPSEIDRPGSPGIVAAGGLRIGAPSGFAGILDGEPRRAARDRGTLSVPGRQLAEWATEQRRLLQAMTNAGRVLRDVALMVHGCGGDIGDLPIAFGENGWMSSDDVAALAQTAKEVVVLTEFQLGEAHSFADNRIHEEEDLQLANNILVVDDAFGLSDSNISPWPPAQARLHSDLYAGGMVEAAVSALARGWECEPSAIHLADGACQAR